MFSFMPTKHFYHKDRALNSKLRQRCSVKSKKSGQGNTFCCTGAQTLACYSLTLLFFFSKWERNKKKKTLKQEHKIFPRHSDFIHKFRVKQFSSLYSTRERWCGVCDFFIKLCSNSNEFRHFISISFRLFRSNSTGFLIMNLFKYVNGYFVNTTNPTERLTNDMKYGIHIETCNSCGDHSFTVEQIFFLNSLQ